MSLASVRSRRQAPNFWPGFVDALAALLMVVVFLVMVFALAQFFLSEALSGRDAALDRLTRQVDQLANLLNLEREANADLRLSVAQLSADLQGSLSENETLVPRIANLTRERDTLLSEREALQQRLLSVELDLASELEARERTAADNDTVRADLEDAFRVIAADKESIELQLRELESLQRDLSALRIVRTDLESQVAELAANLDTSQADLSQTESELGAVRDRSKELQASLAEEQERTSLAQTEIEARDIRLAELLQRAEIAEEAFSDEQEISQTAQSQVDLLNRQLVEIRRQLAALNNALEASESRNEEQQSMIVDLGTRLNQALASRVQELANYRSEFFGRLRQVLGQRADVQIVGDRFVFQSEVLFASGQAELELSGQGQLQQLATTLRQISSTIPDDLDWVLRVDGHTDVRPISTPQFPSNWELSSARATSVVKFLIQSGIPADRLVAAGFGQFHPLDPRDDEISYRRNRRIEFKLTQR